MQRTLFDRPAHALVALVTAAFLFGVSPARADEAGKASATGPAPASEAAPDVAAAPGAAFLAGFKPSVDLRGRFSFADQDRRKDATALTFRARIGLQTPKIAGFRAFAEIEHIEAEDRDSYQAASAHGLGRNRSIIADPESTELNQLWLGYSREGFEARIGRQTLTLDDSRFVGNVGWRQNEQTYDAASLRLQPTDRLGFFYAYVTNVERIFGSQDPRAAGQDDFDSRSHFVTANLKVVPAANLRSYAYFLDLSHKAGDISSSDTFGLALYGKLPIVEGWSGSYELQAATQHDAASSPARYNANYYHAMASMSSTEGLIDTLGAGYEVLQGDDGVGFQTPLATLHKFNGFADVFLDTPGVGLIDRYAWLKLRGPFGIAATVSYHDFAQEDSRGDLGREYDIVLARKLPFGSTALIKYAVFTSESGLTDDIRRFTFQIEYTFGARPGTGSNVTP